MKLHRSWLVAAVIGSHATLLSAQNTACLPYSGQTLNVCNAAIDGSVVFHPIAGLLVSGGNPVIGSASTLGGLGHFSVTLRVNGAKLVTPDLSYDGSGGTTVGKGEDLFAPAPLVEGAIGLFKGLPSGLLAVDFLGSAQLLPTTQIKNLTVDKNARKIGSVALGLGYGARVGVIRGKAVIPSVSVSLMRRDIPKITYGDLTTGDQYRYGLDLHATNLRATAGYKLVVLNLSGGLGWDKYTGTADIAFTDPTDPNPLTNQEVLTPTKLDQSRTMIFLDAALDFPVFKIAVEVGQQFGKQQNFPTTFDGNNPGDGRFFAGAGIRLGF
ncbi:MAG: hypothetical protein ACREMO_01110 [Gemmatimonadales bacterium]